MPQNPIDAALGGAVPISGNSISGGEGAPATPIKTSNPIDTALGLSSQPSNEDKSFASSGGVNPNPGILETVGNYGKTAWNWANTPLVDLHREGATGFESGLENVASGFTSPLSIALTLGTFGTAGFLESAGANVLKEAGLAAPEIAQIGKGAEVVSDALKAGKGIDASLEAAGITPSFYHGAMDKLYQAGLKEADLTSGNLIERSASSLARKTGLSPLQSQNVAKGLQTLTSTGFTVQAAHDAATMSPRVLDALKDGDYEKAAEYATEAAASGLFAVAGAPHMLKSAGELVSPALETKLRPTDETLAFKKLFDVQQGDVQQAQERGRLLEESALEKLGHKNPLAPTTSEAVNKVQNAQLAKMYHGISVGFDQDAAAQHYNAIAEAAGRTDRLPVAEESPEYGQASSPHPSLPSDLKERIAGGNLKSKPKEYIDNLLSSFKGVYEGLSDVEMEVAKDLRDQLNKGFEDAAKSGLMGNRVEDYMRRIWKEENPHANTVVHEANSGKFITDVSMARKRVFQDLLTPLLKGYELKVEDPVRLTSQWLSDTYKAIANRKLVDATLDRGIRASDGLPAAVLKGMGQVVAGEDGKSPATLITPDRVRNIRIGSPEIERLKSSGDLQRFLDNGVIEDRTPRVNMRNINQAIGRLEDSSVGGRIEFDENGNSVRQQKIQLLKDIRDGKIPESDLDTYNETIDPVYVWRPQGHVTVNHPSMRNWNFLTNDPGGNGVILKSDLAIHPEYVDYFKRRLGLDESGLQKWGPTKYLLKGGSLAKKTLLSLSPFHLNQEALRAVMTGVSPVMKSAPTIESSPTLRRMVENGLTVEPDYKAISEHSEGLASGQGHKIISKIPGVGKTLAKSLDWYEDFLFKKYIPNLKARSAELMYDRYREAHPEWSEDKVAELAARHVNDTFGGQNWKAMGRSAASQDWGRLLLLAPDWLESEMRSTARLFNKDEGGIGRAQVAKMAMGMWGVSRVLNMLSTGKPHFEAPFGVAVKNDQGKETVYSIRTMPVDILHMVEDPVGFMRGRLNPLVRQGEEIYSGRDQFGRKLSPGDMAGDIFHNILPLPVQSVGKALSGTGPESSNTDQVVKALGGTATVYRTEAQKKAAELASNHNEDGPLDQRVMAKHRTIMDFEDKIRAGKMPMSDMTQMVISGQLPQGDAKKIIENIKQTKEMNPDQASLFSRASRLPAQELLEVFDLATPSEKQALTPLIVKARRNYLKRAMTQMTPQERMQDTTLTRFMKMFPSAPPPL